MLHPQVSELLNMHAEKLLTSSLSSGTPVPGAPRVNLNKILNTCLFVCLFTLS